jgi:hypothetical protein
MLKLLLMCSRVKIFVLVKMREDETKVDSLAPGWG